MELYLLFRRHCLSIFFCFLVLSISKSVSAQVDSIQIVNLDELQDPGAAPAFTGVTRDGNVSDGTFELKLKFFEGETDVTNDINTTNVAIKFFAPGNEDNPVESTSQLELVVDANEENPINGTLTYEINVKEVGRNGIAITYDNDDDPNNDNSVEQKSPLIILYGQLTIFVSDDIKAGLEGIVSSQIDLSDESKVKKGESITANYIETNSLVFSSSDEDVASVDENGLVDLKAAGGVDIFVNIASSSDVYLPAQEATIKVTSIELQDRTIEDFKLEKFDNSNPEVSRTDNDFETNYQENGKLSISANANPALDQGESIEYTITDGNEYASIDGNEELKILGATPDGQNVVIQAKVAEGNGYKEATATINLKINKAETTIENFSPPSNPRVGDNNYLLNATTNSENPVRYESSNTNIIDIINDNELKFIIEGNVNITAIVDESPNFKEKRSDPFPIFVRPAAQPQVINFTTPTLQDGNILDKTFGDVSFIVNADSDAGLDNKYSSSDLTVATIDENTGEVTINGAGPTTITAFNNGNENFNSSEASFTLNVAKANQIITFNQNFENLSKGSEIALTAEASSGLPVSFRLEENQGVAEKRDNRILITGVGSFDIIAFQDGNENYNPANEVILTATVPEVSFSLQDTSLILKRSDFLTDSSFTIKVAVSTSNENATINKVNLEYRKISNPNDDSLFKTADTTSSTNGEFGFAINFEENNLPFIGLEYYFEVDYEIIEGDVKTQPITNPNSSSGYFYTYRTYPNGLDIVNLKSGKESSDYQFISFPLNLDNASAGAVLEDDLDSYNDKQWRAFAWEDSIFVEFPFGDFEVGKAYNLIVRKKDKSINSGSGIAVEVTKDNPYEITLNKGWNLIASPYPFDVSWQKVIESNSTDTSVVDTELTVYNGGYTIDSENLLRDLEGAFVFSESVEELKIPVEYDNSIQSSGRRKSKIPSYTLNSIDKESWEVNLNLVNNSIDYNIGGFGMNVLANLLKDRLDKMAPPRVGEYLEIYTKHSDYFYPWFTKDVVPSQENYIWDFTLATSSPDEITTLSWDNTYFGENDKELYLYLVETGRIVNMREQQNVSFKAQSQSNIKIFYGNKGFIDYELIPESNFIGKPYPNPVRNIINLPLSIKRKSILDVYIIDLQGREVFAKKGLSYAQGFHTLSFEIRDLVKGIYLHRTVITDLTGIKRITTEKFIVR